MRTATIEDFVRPEFIGKRPLDYEVTDDGTVARKDRWKVGFQQIAEMAGEFEPIDIEEVIKRVSIHLGGWLYISEEPKPSVAFIWRNIDVMLIDGSLIFGLVQHAKTEGYSGDRFVCARNGEVFDAEQFGHQIIAYRPMLDDDNNLMPVQAVIPAAKRAQLSRS